ncbi:MAG: gliding motility protein GldC [Cytophagales bacterium]|nr:MAG: gliding motility protein GldC [Cytophagales bacterium]TAF62080.1 MAG: gliding motility protein GldC [Cytophagales bacterium]
MKQHDIRLSVELDDNQLPDKIFWNATDSPTGRLEEAKAFILGIWDHKQRETLRIDLWTKDMTTDDMKRFCIDILGGLSETMRNSTDDEFVSRSIHELCVKLVSHLQTQNRGE